MILVVQPGGKSLSDFMDIGDLVHNFVDDGVVSIFDTIGVLFGDGFNFGCICCSYLYLCNFWW